MAPLPGIVAQVEPNLHPFPAQEAHQLLHQPLGRPVQRFRVELAAQVGGRMGPQADLDAIRRLVAQEQAEVAHAGQRLPHLLEPADAEVRGGDVQLPARLFSQQVVEDVGQPVLDVVDDVGDAHHG